MSGDIIALESLNKLYADIYDSIAKNPRTVIFSVAASQRAHIAACSRRKILYITDAENLDRTAEILLQLGVKTATLIPQHDILLHKSGVNLSAVQEKIVSLYTWIRNKADVLLITPESLLRYLPHKNTFEKCIIKISEGATLEPRDLADDLVRAGYRKEVRAEEKGSFAMLGEVIELFPIDSALPVRIAFEFDTVESIRQFQPDTMSGGAKFKSLTVLPSTDFLTDTLEKKKLLEDIEKAKGMQSAKAALRTEQIISDIAYRLEVNEKDAALGWLTPFVRKQLSTIFDYLPKDTLIIYDEPKIIFDALNAESSKHRERVIRLNDGGEVLKTHINAELTVEDANSMLASFASLGYSNFTTGQSDANNGLFVFESTNLPSYFKDINLLIKDIYDYKSRGYTIKLFCGNREWEKTMRGFLPDIDIEFSDKKLSRGFVSRSAKTLVVGTSEMYVKSDRASHGNIYGERRSIAPRIGDYVVHDEYGIGKCMGVIKLKSYIGEHDYLLLQYAENNKIYLPVHQMDMLHLYAGAETNPKLSNPNKEEFKKDKEKAKKSIHKLAIDLLELYAKREKSKGYKYPLDTTFQKEFEQAFEFEETRDQLIAVEDIKKDMERGKVMDRLLCGDVGFGKTEVALRAIFKTVMENKQAAVLAPTTILAEQHFMTISARFRTFGIKAACLTRFRTPAETKEILAGIQNGSISVVIGTHRLFSKDVAYYDLGLLVLDEEQRFGVEHKEKIKTLRTNINVLSLSATPIPRTLHMALSGIRDVSVLDIAPKGRHPVETIVAEYSEGLVKEAVTSEIERGGQVFILYNRIEKIYRYASELSALFPSLRIVIGHGKMNSAELEKNIYKFYNKEADILLSTTIIENGIDIPNANTLIVLDADKLGLAEMYQLKGRVGRSTRIASAYFTYFIESKIVGNVEKRLSALLDNSELGSGYRLAMMDLEIRGAGNVLGREQHGHVEKIGYDMYSRLLRETVALLSGEAVASHTDTEVSIKADAYISDKLIPSERERLKLYKRIAEIKSLKERNALEKDIEDMYGKIASPIKNLLDISLIRVLGGDVGAVKVSADEAAARIIFADKEYLKSAAVKNAVTLTAKDCRVKQKESEVELLLPKAGISEKIQYLIKFLLNANGIYN